MSDVDNQVRHDIESVISKPHLRTNASLYVLEGYALAGHIGLASARPHVDHYSEVRLAAANNPAIQTVTGLSRFTSVRGWVASHLQAKDIQ
jgi:hypothetical protein